LWDHIHRIVPPDYEPADSDEVKVLCNTTDFLRSIDPKPYRQETFQRFKEKLPEWSAAAAAFHPVGRDARDLTRISEAKVYHELLDELTQRGIFTEGSGGWYEGPADLIGQYMVYLATSIAEGSGLSLFTNSPAAWTSQCFFGVDGNVAQDAEPRPTGAVAYLAIKDFLPENLLSIPLKDLLEFRDETTDARRRLVGTATRAALEISATRDPIVFEDKLNGIRHELKTAMDDYRAAQRENWHSELVGASIVCTTISGELLADFFDPGHLVQGMIAIGGLSIGLLWGLQSLRQGQRDLSKSNTASYLVDLEKRWGPREFVEDNEKLWKKMKEFVLD